MKQDFQNEFAPHIGKQQHDKTGNRPAHSQAPTPAPDKTTCQQSAKHQPGKDGKKRFMTEAHGLAKDFLGKQYAASNRQCQQHKAGTNQFE